MVTMPMPMIMVHIYSYSVLFHKGWLSRGEKTLHASHPFLCQIMILIPIIQLRGTIL